MTPRLGPMVAAVALSMTGLAACSGGDQAYCDQLESTAKELDVEVNAQDYGALSKQLKTMQGHVQEIRDVAPEEMKKHWASIDESIAGVSPALQELAKAGDLTKLSPQEQAELMKKVDVDELKKLGPTVEKAGKAIQKDGKDRCGLDLQ